MVNGVVIDKVDNYYLSDLQWYIVRKYPNIRNSFYYEFQRDSFLAMFVDSDEEFFEHAKIGIRNSIKEDLELQKHHMKDDPGRMNAAACCLALIDLVT